MKTIKAKDMKDASTALSKAADNEANFVPNSFQSRVKSRFYRRLDEMSHITDKETVFKSKELLGQLAGTDRIFKWLESPAFSSWFVEDQFIVDTISSLQDKAVQVIQDILSSDDASEGDKLKAARMMLELGDQFPGRKSEVRFLDDRLNALSERDTEQEIAKIQKQLQIEE